MSIKVMSRFETYSIDQLLELVRNGRADVSKKAADEIRVRVQSRRTQDALDTCPRCEGVGSYCDYIGVRQCGLCGGTGKCQ